MKILVTGGAGFIGRNLVPRLMSEGHEVRIFDRELERAPIGVAAIQGDVRDLPAVRRAVAGLDAIVHLAAFTRVVESVASPEQALSHNIVGTFNCLEAARLEGTPRLVFASTNAAAGAQAPPIHEQLVPRPLSPYGASKLAGEGLCSAYAQTYGLQTVALRFANVYGPSSHTKESVIPLFLRQIAAGEPLTVYGDGSQTRDFIHVTDICRAINAALAIGAGGEVFQIATETETSIMALIELLRRVTQRALDVRFSPARPGEIARNFSSIEKARAQLGFEPRVQLEDGLRDSWATEMANATEVRGHGSAGA